MTCPRWRANLVYLDYDLCAMHVYTLTDCVWGGIEDTSLQISLSCFNAAVSNKCPSVLHPQTLLTLSRSISSVLHPVLLPFKLPSWIRSALFVLLFLFCNLDSVVLESRKKASQLAWLVPHLISWPALWITRISEACVRNLILLLNTQNSGQQVNGWNVDRLVNQELCWYNLLQY